jgi:hypothetical protein
MNCRPPPWSVSRQSRLAGHRFRPWLPFKVLHHQADSTPSGRKRPLYLTVAGRTGRGRSEGVGRGPSSASSGQSQEDRLTELCQVELARFGRREEGPIRCRLTVGVSRSGFHTWLTRTLSARARGDEVLGTKVRARLMASGRTYGARVWHDVPAEGSQTVSLKRSALAQMTQVTERRHPNPDIASPASRKDGGGLNLACPAQLCLAARYGPRIERRLPLGIPV